MHPPDCSSESSCAGSPRELGKSRSLGTDYGREALTDRGLCWALQRMIQVCNFSLVFYRISSILFTNRALHILLVWKGLWGSSIQVFQSSFSIYRISSILVTGRTLHIFRIGKRSWGFGWRTEGWPSQLSSSKMSDKSYRPGSQEQFTHFKLAFGWCSSGRHIRRL